MSTTLQMGTPRELAARAEEHPQLPAGREERFAGYGVMGLPFASGHILALRRFPASSVGPAYSSVWHRSPDGAWRFYADVEPPRACTRYFGRDVAVAVVDDIRITWTGAYGFTVCVEGAGLDWAVRLVATPVTRALSGVAHLLPAPLWRSAPFLSLVGRAAGGAMAAGRMRLHGRASNGQRFRAIPRTVWLVDTSTALHRGVDLGPPGAVRHQARLGDFWIPQRGIFMAGRVFFEPAQ